MKSAVKWAWYHAAVIESPRPIWVTPAIGGGLALIMQSALGWRVGTDLHTFFGGVLIATLVASPFAAIGNSLLEQTLLIVAVTLGISVGWWLPVSHEALIGSISARCSLIIFAWTFSIIGTSALLARIFREPTLGAAATTLLAFVWLAAPIWLGMHAAFVVQFHPLFAMNVALIDLGLWTEQPFEYRYLFSLGQDVPYLLPSTIWISVGLHALIGFLSSAAGLARWFWDAKKPAG